MGARCVSSTVTDAVDSAVNKTDGPSHGADVLIYTFELGKEGRWIIRK